jgi:hypothetical protein
MKLYSFQYLVVGIVIRSRARICKRLRSPEIDSASLSTLAGRYDNPEPVFLNVYGAQKAIPRNEFRQTM